MRWFVIPTIVITLLSAVPVIAQNPVSKNHLNFRSKPTLCGGQIVKEGLICIKNLSESQGKDTQRVAMIFDLGHEAIFIIKVYEFRPNKIGVSYVIKIDMFVEITNSKVPIAQSFVKKDGTTLVDPKYGEYGPKEAVENLKKYDEEIRLLLSALK
jgi:hypothetical protein